MNGISVLIKNVRMSLLAPFTFLPLEDGKIIEGENRSSPDTESEGDLILDFTVLKIINNRFLLFRIYLVWGRSSMKQEYAKTWVKFTSFFSQHIFLTDDYFWKALQPNFNLLFRPKIWVYFLAWVFLSFGEKLL